MKTRIFTLIAVAAIILSTHNAQATIRRVGYPGTAVSGTDYSDLQSAHDAAKKGDTLLIFPGSYNATYTKKLVTIGYGYFVTGSGSNAGLQNITGALSIQVNLNTGSDTSTFTGLDGFTLDEPTGVNINSVTVNRCNINAVYFEDKTYNSWQITQCAKLYIESEYSTTKVTNLLVKNCIIQYVTFQPVSGQFSQFINNVITNNIEFNNASSVLQNNVFLGGHNDDNNCVYNNNIAYSSYALDTAGSNKNVDDYSTIFVGYPTQGSYSNDGLYVLKNNSPAKGAGAGGTDCSIFGGNNPYKLSGIPAIPAFYKLTAPSSTTSSNPYTITFSVRSNN